MSGVLALPSAARGAVGALAAACAALGSAPAADAAIALRGAASANTGPNNANSLAIGRPAGLAVGDVMLATIAKRNTSTITPPSGWTQVGSLDSTAGTVLHQATYVKVTTAADTTATSFSFSFATNARSAGGIVAYSGVDSVSPVGASSTNPAATTGTTATAIGVTPPHLNSRIVVAASWASSGSLTSDARTTERYEVETTNNTAGNNVDVEAADMSQAGASATGNFSPTHGANAHWIAQAVALSETPELAASFPTSYAWPSLVPATTSTSSEQLVSVTSNRSWGVRVSSDRSTGRLTEWNGSAYGSRTLTSPMQWRLTSLGGAAQSTAYANLSGTQATVVTNRAASSSAVGVGVTYRQPVSYADEPGLPGGSTYRQVVSYSAEQGF